MKITKKRKYTVTAGRTARARQFGIKAARVGKTKQVKVLQGNYGYGWDDLCQYEMNQSREIKDDLKAYRENQPANYRVIQRRVPNPDYKETPVEETTSVKRKYTVKASQFSKGMLSDMKYAIWVFEENTNQWELYGGSFSKRVVKGFLDSINGIDTDKYYTDVIVLPFGETPDDGRPVKASSCTSANNIYADDGYSDKDNTRFEREQFAERIVHEIEDEYSIKVSDDAWEQIYDLADDLSFCAGAHKHGSTPMLVLEDTIYDIIEEDTGVVIGSTGVSRNAVTAARADTTVSQEDVDELVLTITNDGDLYRRRTTPIIKNLARKVKNGTYDRELAVKAWQYLADDGVRMYDKEFGSGKGSVAWLNKATREAIARELRDYYEEQITYEEQAIDSATEITCSSSVDTDEVQDIIRNAGITVYGVEKTRTHLGDEYKIILDTVDDCSAVMDALRNAGYSVKLDTIDGESVVFLFITAPDEAQSGVAYRVTFGYQSEIVYMDDETTDYGAILDACIDKLESEGKTGCFVNPDEYNEDEYVIGGNHGLALYTGGNFSIDKCEDSVTSAVATNHGGTKIYGADSQRDAEYLNALGSGVVDELNQYFGDTPIFDGDFIYEISDNAITFMTSGNGEVIFIQPLDDIEPNMDDLESDIEDLYISIYSDTMPKF